MIDLTINLATKYADVIDERFALESLTATAVNSDYDFSGAQTVKVYAMDTAPLNDYVNSGYNRYGIPAELGDAVQELTMRKKRSFTFTIDRTNAADSPEGIRDAANALSRQLNEVVIPEIDMWRLLCMAQGGAGSKTLVITASNAYSEFLGAMAEMTENKVPVAGRVAFVTPGYYSLLKQDGAFISAGDMAQDMLVKGQVGMVDGAAIVVVPSSYLPAGVSFLITHPCATTAPQKLAEYTIHENPPGIAGNLVEGLTYYDAFVLENKKDAIFTYYGQEGNLQITMEAALTGTGTLHVSGNTEGGVLYYKAASSVTAPSFGDVLSDWTELPADGNITATAGNKVAVAVTNSDGDVVAVSNVITVVVG